MPETATTLPLPLLAPLFDITPLQDALAQGQLILTPNQRLARAIQQAWGLSCHQQGKSTWFQAPVYALDHWLSACWQDLRDAAFQPALTGNLVSEHLELCLWTHIIAADEQTPAQSSITGFADLARQARQYLELWQIDDLDVGRDQTLFDNHQGYQLLQHWLPKFRSEMATRKLFTPEQVLDLVEQGFTTATLSTLPLIYLVGFQTLAPKQRQLLESASDALSEFNPNPSAGNYHLAPLPDSDTEIAQAAQWAQQQLQQHPQQRIGIVFPDLTQIRNQVERQFRAVLEPEYCLPDTPNTLPPFNISAGIPLAQTPLIQTALKLLTLHETPHALAFYCTLLNNPFWGDCYRETELRSNAEVRLHDLEQITLKPGDFRFVIQRAQDALNTLDTHTEALDQRDTEYSELSTRLQGAADRARRYTKKQTFSAWATCFTEQLEILGWPGTRTLDSIEYQQLQHWRQILDHFIQLDATNTLITWPEALKQLRQLNSRAIFQAQTPDSPIQILGVLEAAGLRFDALWIAGLNDEQWPQPVHMHPLLPARLQKQAAMPRTSAERELTLARELLSGFSSAAKHVVFSYTERDGDVEKRPSPLLQELSASTPLDTSTWSAISLDHPLAKRLAETSDREWITWEQAPVFDPRIEHVRGGSSLLRDQAACPFNAFARWRLGARPLPEPSPGLSVLERGNLLHRCLEIFWQQTQTQNALLALNEDDKNQRLNMAIASALDETARYRPELNGLRFRRIESTRLQKLLRLWLSVEAKRPAFSIAANEQAITLQLQTGKASPSLQLPLRIDRIDLLADGRLLLLDYKTGKADINGWAGLRPEQPQLPLYALAITDELNAKPTKTQQPTIAALCFAQISTTKGLALKGITDNEELYPLPALSTLELPATWEATIEHWRDCLETLAGEFIGGEAEIGYYTDAAKYQSHLIPLNRLAEQDDIQALYELEQHVNNSGIN